MIKDFAKKLQHGKCSKMELILTGICLFLLGVVIGMKFAPARFTTVGCFNGNTGSMGDPKEMLNKLYDQKDKHECCCHEED